MAQKPVNCRLSEANCHFAHSTSLRALILAPKKRQNDAWDFGRKPHLRPVQSFAQIAQICAKTPDRPKVGNPTSENGEFRPALFSTAAAEYRRRKSYPASKE